MRRLSLDHANLMVVIAKTSNKLIRIVEFHIEYVSHAHNLYLFAQRIFR